VAGFASELDFASELVVSNRLQAPPGDQMGRKVGMKTR